jgi:ketosteroid isomerase-like protein
MADMLSRSIIAALLLWASFVLAQGQQREYTLSGQERTQVIAKLREAYAAFNRGDMDAAVSGLATDIDWREPAAFPGGGAYRGREAVKGYLAQSRAAWEEGSSEPEQLIPVANRIVVFVHAHFRLKGSGQWQDVRLADVYTIRNGVPVAMRAFADRDEAMRWSRGAGSDGEKDGARNSGGKIRM